MQKVKKGDYVTTIYEGTLATGELFDSATQENPFEFVVGQNSVFPSFEAGVLGMKEGETRIIKISPEESYGQHREELVQIMDRSVFGQEIDLHPGVIMGMTIEKNGQKHQVPAMIVAIKGDKVTVDYNHPLAGQELLYQITLQAIAEDGGTVNPKGCDCPEDSCGCN